LARRPALACGSVAASVERQQFVQLGGHRLCGLRLFGDGLRAQPGRQDAAPAAHDEAGLTDLVAGNSRKTRLVAMQFAGDQVVAVVRRLVQLAQAGRRQASAVHRRLGERRTVGFVFRRRLAGGGQRQHAQHLRGKRSGLGKLVAVHDVDHFIVFQRTLRLRQEILDEVVARELLDHRPADPAVGRQARARPAIPRPDQAPVGHRMGGLARDHHTFPAPGV
jgi:hypothetical protein